MTSSNIFIEILDKVKNPPPLIRPSVSKNLAQPEAINIMRQCWAGTYTLLIVLIVLSTRNFCNIKINAN